MATIVTARQLPSGLLGLLSVAERSAPVLSDSCGTPPASR